MRGLGLARAAAPLAVAVAGYQWLVRPRFASRGATPQELVATYPGDDLIPGGRRHSLMATTIAAPSHEVWRWLVQMGADRGGFYSWDRLDNGGRPSAERIHEEWQNLRAGDRIASVPNASRWFDVALLEPERVLVLRARLTLPRGWNFDPAVAAPRFFTDSTWGFFLTPTPDGQTRLIVTGKARNRPRWAAGLVNWLFWDPAHWVMQTRQFAGLQRRAERHPSAGLSSAQRRSGTAAATTTVG